jgi:hypothetical protein
MKKKIDVDFPKYVILGACNPPFAHKALQAEEELGLLLPCNLIVYEKEGKDQRCSVRSNGDDEDSRKFRSPAGSARNESPARAGDSSAGINF